MTSSEPAAGAWVFLSHTLERVGPPMFLLHFLRWLGHTHARPIHVVSLSDGDLRSDFEEVCAVTLASEIEDAMPQGLVDPALVYVNTAISIRAVQLLPPSAAPVVVHIHELEVGLSLHIDAFDREHLHRWAGHWVAASSAVAANLVRNHGVPAGLVEVHHEMIDTRLPPMRMSGSAARSQLGIAPEAPLVGTAAVVCWRKAPDLFLHLGWLLDRAGLPTGPHLLWVGGGDSDPATAEFRADIDAAGLSDRVHVLPAVPEPIDWMRALDVFVLPAREDAFPLACLEAAAVAVPTVCFESGGMPEFVGTDCGVVVPYPDIERFAASVADLLVDRDRRVRLGANAQAKVRAQHDIEVAAPRLYADLVRWAGSAPTSNRGAG